MPASVGASGPGPWSAPPQRLTSGPDAQTPAAAAGEALGKTAPALPSPVGHTVAGEAAVAGGLALPGPAGRASAGEAPGAAALALPGTFGRQAAGELAVAAEGREGLVAEAQKVQQEFSLLAASGSPANRAYLERLSRAAAEAAAKGYGVQRLTHTVRRTRVRKTTTTTDVRTLETETSTEERATVDSWTEEGPPTLSGVGVMCARGTRVVGRFSDGSEEVQDVKVRGGTMFWLGGDPNSVQTRTYDFAASSGCSDHAGAEGARPRPEAPMIMAAAC